MTKQEAIKAMERGEKVTHRYFSKEEYVYTKGKGDRIYMEDGASIEAWIFWEDRNHVAFETDWSIYQPEGTGALAD